MNRTPVTGKRKVCVVVASRANYGRVKSLLTAIREHPRLELQLIVGASALLSRFGNAIDVIRAEGFDPNATVYCVIEGENPAAMAKSTGLAIIELATIFENLKPDIVLSVADRYETMATAIAASYMNIPLAHTQGGEVTDSIDESVRHAITKLAHLHFPATETSAANIVRMGEDEGKVFVTGCPSIDLIAHRDLSINDELMRPYKGVGAEVEWSKPYLLVLQHPVTTEFGDGIRQVNETIAAIDELRMQTVWLWPNIDAGSDDIAKGIRVYRERSSPRFLALFRNFPPEVYARVLNNAVCIVGNSSSGLREGAFLGVPCVNIGSRQNRRERGPNVIDVGYSRTEILAAIRRQIEHGRYPCSPLFGDGCAGRRIAELLAAAEVSVQKTLTYVL